MRKWLSASLVSCGALLLGTGVLAQTPPPAVPEVMPFDIPYGTPLTLDQAKHVAELAFAEAKRHNWKMVISVVDPSGDLIYFERMDGAQLASVAISQHKARVAALFRRETKVFEDATEAGHTYVLSLDGAIASRGGFPLVAGGKLVGAIGCSGGLGAQDYVTCKAGADSVN
jgi:glc operon protein GlcG